MLMEYRAMKESAHKETVWAVHHLPNCASCEFNTTRPLNFALQSMIAPVPSELQTVTKILLTGSLDGSADGST